MAIKFEPQQEEKTYKVGDTFLFANKEPVVINRVKANEVILSSILYGCRLSAPMSVNDDMKITEHELDHLTGGASSEFTKRDFKPILI